jgi:carnitine 3-dehydrogenase
MSTSRVEPTAVGKVAVVGAGVIGGGWAAHFLRMGLDVNAYDPESGAEVRLRTLIDEAWPTLERLGLAAEAGPHRLQFSNDLGAVLEDADFVQENTPEDAGTKPKMLAEIDRLTPESVVIASSTSGFSMTMLQQHCAHPERTVIGHPFNPPYLIPLVEVVGGERTEADAVDWAVALYAHLGKYPMRLQRELPGFVANRLQEALWREALHMVAADEATVEEIDAAIAHGPGLRWALMGPCLTFHLAGGAGGMGHMLDHFGAALLEPWTRLEAPTLTSELRDRMVDGCVAESGDRSIQDLERQRDDFLVDLLDLVRRSNDRYGVGQEPSSGSHDEIAAKPERFDEAAAHPLGS